MVKQSSSSFSAASVARTRVTLSKAVEKSLALEAEISRLRHHVSVLSKRLHSVTSERNDFERLFLELTARTVAATTGGPSGDEGVEEVEVAGVRVDVAPTLAEASSVASGGGGGVASVVGSEMEGVEASVVALVGGGGVASVEARGGVVEVPRSSPACDVLWEPVLVRRRRGRANSVMVGSGSRVLAGGIGDGTAVSLVPSSPPLPPPPPEPVLRPVLHARESSVVTVGRGAGRRGRRTR